MAQNFNNIKNFYNDTTILITGGTGFLGKVLIEKLLRTFNVKNIIILIRLKNSSSIDERLSDFLKESIFDRIQNECPESLKKIIAVKVDYNAYDLDIMPEEKKRIIETVDIVFNILASVKFNEKFKDAFNINVNGTRKILNLSLDIKNLRGFLHISTLYSNCHLNEIEEKVYEPEICFEKMLQVIELIYLKKNIFL